MIIKKGGFGNDAYNTTFILRFSNIKNKIIELRRQKSEEMRGDNFETCRRIDNEVDRLTSLLNMHGID